MTTGTTATPSSLSTNSRIWFECAMPRLLSTYSPRFRSPRDSSMTRSSDVSTNDEMFRRVCRSAPPSAFRTVITTVMPAALR